MGTGGGYNYKLLYWHENKWNKQKIQKNDIIKEYNVIHDEIINKYFQEKKYYRHFKIFCKKKF